MGALEHNESGRDKRDIEGQFPSRPSSLEPRTEGQKGHPPYRGVPSVPVSLRRGLSPLDKPPLFTSEDRAEFEERAAVREFDGGLSRPVAERLALLDLQAARKA